MGVRLDRWLTQLAPEFSRNHLQSLIERGAVRVDGQPALWPARKLRIRAAGGGVADPDGGKPGLSRRAHGLLPSSSRTSTCWW